MEMYLVEYDEHDGEIRYGLFGADERGKMVKWMNNSQWRNFLSVRLIQVIKHFNIGFVLTEK